MECADYGDMTTVLVNTQTPTNSPSTFGVNVATTMFLLLPVAGFAAAFIFSLTPSPAIIVTTVVMYYLSMFGITIGWHRGLTHGGFRTSPRIRELMTIAGCLAFQGSPVGWVASHRQHHQFSDQPGDPHSPWTVREGRFFRLRGFWHAQSGWLYDGVDTDTQRYAPDLLKDPVVMRVERYWWLYGLAGLVVIPAAVGFLVDGWLGAVTCVVWAGLIRLGFSHFFAWMTNSAGHMFGLRPFRTRDNSTNIWWMVPFTVGEGWHNGHHAYATSPRHGLLKGQLDPSARVIRWGERLGIVTGAKWMSDEKVAKKLKPRSEW
mgnify:CR=1 FL=1